MDNIENIETGSNIVIFIIMFLVGIGGTVSAAYARYRRKNRTVIRKNSPILLAYYTENSQLIKIKKDEHKDYSLTAYGVVGRLKRSKNDYDPSATGGSTIIEVKLPFKTALHLLAITSREDMAKIRTDVGNSVMEKVSLEGNYDDYFSLFADKGSQVQSRYIIDPKAMVFTMDFCKSHSWEIIGSEFYFVQENVPNLEGDTTSMWDDVEQFVEEIRPAVEVPLTDEDRKLRASYGGPVKGKKDIRCPLCTTTLIETSDDIYECQYGHGLLLHGSDLDELRAGKLETKFQLKEIDNIKHEIACPSCGSTMHKVNYAGSGIMIDSCQSCVFRWVDAGELSKSVIDF